MSSPVRKRFCTRMRATDSALMPLHGAPCDWIRRSAWAMVS